MNKEQVLKILKYEKLSNEELSELLWLVNKDMYYERPVTIEEFISSDDFVHKKWPNVYPIWQDTLKQIFPTPFTAPYNEILISAAAGAGKTVVATISNLYDMHKLGCLKDPCEFYRLGPKTMLIFAVFSATGSTAAVNWQDLTTGIELCPWINEKVVDRKGLEKKSGSLVPVEILPGIYIQTGSRFQHSMGKAIFDGLMDEAAFGGDNIKEAQKTYDELSSRMATRFRSYSKSGNLPGHLFLISSPKEAGDFMQYRIDTALKSGSKRVLVKKNISSWDANPANDSDDKFTVFVGNEFKEPKIYEEDEQPSIEDMDYLIYPPMSYYDNFKMDILGSIMNYGGVTTISDTGVFKSPTLVNDAMILKNPFNMDIIQLPFAKDDKQLMDFMDMSYFKDIRHPEANRFIHIDVAFSSNTIDRYGIAAGYCVLTNRNIYKELTEDGKNISEVFNRSEKMFYVDWALGIEPCKNQEIPLSKVCDFIFYLIKQMKYPVASISADTFQSKQTLQTFEQEKYETASISVDRSRDPYLFLKRIIYNKQCILPKVPELKLELLGLRDDGKKIDHRLRCFTIDTKIQLLDGRSVSIQDLLEEQNYKVNWVYTFNESTQQIEPKKIKHVFQSGIVKNLVRVTLDNGETITCTPEHRFMLRDGSYEEIKNLSPGTSLMPLYTKVAEKGLRGYRLYYEPMQDKWHFEHRSFGNPTGVKKKLVHHCNYNKLDNSPDNLKLLTKSEHMTIHNNNTKDYDIVAKKVSEYHKKAKNSERYKIRNFKIRIRQEAYRNKVLASLTEEERYQKIKHKIFRKKLEEYFNVKYDNLSTKERRHFIAKFIRIFYPDMTQKISNQVSERHKQGRYKKVSEVIRQKMWITDGKETRYIFKYEPIPEGFKQGRTLSKEWVENIKKSHQHTNWTEEQRREYSKKQSENTSNRIWVTNGVDDKYINKNMEIPEGYYRGRSKHGKNHKIINIEFIKMPCKVYDLEIEDNHNFALASGVFVHNCRKDISDAVAGSIWNCANSNKIINLARLSSATLNPFTLGYRATVLSEQDIKNAELAEFEKMRTEYSSGIFKNL